AIRHGEFKLKWLPGLEPVLDLGRRQCERLRLHGMSRHSQEYGDDAEHGRPARNPSLFLQKAAWFHHGAISVYVSVALSAPVNALAPLVLETNNPRYRVTAVPLLAVVVRLV